jgi:hypothetical protein
MLGDTEIMFTFTVGSFRIACAMGELPALYPEFAQRAALLDRLDEPHASGDRLYVAASVDREVWPRLVIVDWLPLITAGFHPEVLVVPETSLLFLGSGERLLAYELRAPRRLWEDHTPMGFWGWARFDPVVLMSAELEFAAWSLDGRKLWSTFVEPPWDFSVRSGIIHLDVVGEHSEFPLTTGPLTQR